MANWKMTTGRLAIGEFMLDVQTWLLSAVKSSGAVSPLIRATASRMPVMMPAFAARTVTSAITFHCGAPSGRGFAQAVRDQAQHVFRRADHHWNHDQGERHGAGPGGEMPDADHIGFVDEQADDDRRGGEQDVVDEA